jgi:hypothetical protein
MFVEKKEITNNNVIPCFGLMDLTSYVFFLSFFPGYPAVRFSVGTIYKALSWLVTLNSYNIVRHSYCVLENLEVGEVLRCNSVYAYLS